MDSKKHLSKILNTGEYIVIKNALPENYRSRLAKLADKLDNPRSRPIYIANEISLGKTTIERYKASGIHILLSRTKPLIESMIGTSFLVLTNKVLLRRTWPISEEEARNLGHNASNLTWHQDSNIRHGDKPMIVMMVSLQDGAGSTKPGLSILKSPTRSFRGIYGYEGKRVEEFKEEMLTNYGAFNVENPELNAGDLLIFDGLTFHRTFSHQSMNSPRDALLVRIIKPNDAANFAKGPHLTIKF